MQRRIIGLVGLIGSGKGTVGDCLVKRHQFQAMSFANSLKDAVSAIFDWPRDMLEGDTAASRVWRETSDEYWSRKLNKDITPRWILQNIGTDVMRNCFDPSIWIWSLERKLMNSSQSVVITDVRFQNEITMINHLGGEIWWIRRDPEPKWLPTALTNAKLMPVLCPEVHASEYEWLRQGQYHEIQNNQSLDYLQMLIDKKISLLQ
jgi:hypothetical protein